jgi:F-type H+-transporting ATPase subunit delta
MSALAKRYARAAVETAEQKAGAKGVEALASGLTTFRGAYRDSAELRDVVRNPALREQRATALGAVIKKLGVSAEAQRLVLLLAERDRIDVLDEVVSETQQLTDERLGRARAFVTSAVALTAAQEKRLAAALEKRFGQPVALSISVDPSIMGGLVCQVRDVTMDSSVRRQLETLRERLLA